MANLLRLLATSLVLVTAVRAHGQYEDSSNGGSNRKSHSNLFVALTPSGQMFHKKPPSPSPQQVFHQLPDAKSPADLPEENGYQIPWIEMMPRRENRGRRVKKLPGQSGGGHVQSKVKNSIPVDTNPTAREARGRDNNRYDVPLIECRPMSPYLLPLQQLNRLNGHHTVQSLPALYRKPPHVPVPDAITATEPVEWISYSTITSRFIQSASPCPRS
ncbi:hypothetical protein AVEN_214270-1 [Araneus ventricosus]|uniref:Uncharacterized protein n=1 Tax=Araneus ventricosus TaxID=182803 RepID=A0A4Y2WR44_ARAVE|nr:hypothetical protein AVEN_214270-1 [Araneus ventricosus]